MFVEGAVWERGRRTTAQPGCASTAARGGRRAENRTTPGTVAVPRTPVSFWRGGRTGRRRSGCGGRSPRRPSRSQAPQDGGAAEATRCASPVGAGRHPQHGRKPVPSRRSGVQTRFPARSTGTTTPHTASQRDGAQTAGNAQTRNVPRASLPAHTVRCQGTASRRACPAPRHQAAQRPDTGAGALATQ